MTHKIKTLGLAVVAVLAMSAVVASAASATPANFTASSYPANLSGGQTTKHIWTFQGQKVECSEASLTGSYAAASPQLTVKATYGGCPAFGFIGAKVDMNSCDYLFTAGTKSAGGSVGSVHIQCSTAGDSITITAGGCVVHIPPQTPTGNVVDYANVHPGVLITSTLTGIHSNITSGFGCTLSSNPTDTSGATTGSFQLNPQAGVTFDVG